ncbi:MAG: OmpA family protein, partial [Spirochaetes bacterium]|nr:OmpA family protein [Spirochaetota bacterium]
ETVYISYCIDGKWSLPKPIDELNSKYDDQTPFISHDGNVILFSSNREGTLRPPKTNEPVYYLTNDLYISFKQNNKWSTPQRLTGEVNTIENERAPSLSKDGKTIFFSRYKGNDIYSSKIYSADLDGISTSNVQLLPKPVNSDYSDFGLMPSHSKPGFYFSSNRPGGFGLWDIYFVSYINNEFGEPINLGLPINSENNDLSITELGDKIYFCSDRKGGAGGSDVYAILLSKKVIQLPDTGFVFSLIDKKRQQGIAAPIEVIIYPPQKEGVQEVKKITITTDEKGICEVKTNYDVPKIEVQIRDDRYKPVEMAFDVSPGEMRKIAIELEEIEKKEEPKVAKQIQQPTEPQISQSPPLKLNIRPIYFEYKSSKISKGELNCLAKIAQQLKHQKPLCLKVVGHTDYKGGDSYNMRLGMARAMAVKNALERCGVKAIYEVYSKGRTQPSELYRKTKDHKYNRRVEIYIESCKTED